MAIRRVYTLHSDRHLSSAAGTFCVSA